MKLFILSQSYNTDYDTYDAKIVRAETEEQAREIANEVTGCEGKIWCDPSKSRCEALTTEGEAESILESFNAG